MMELHSTPLHHSADLADPFDFCIHKNQLILAKQLIKHGASVNATPLRKGETPLHSTCHGFQVTNLDLIELLLVEGADPNAQDVVGRTPLMYTIPLSPSAAKYLLNWPT
jgi:ankyrin repeat protein